MKLPQAEENGPGIRAIDCVLFDAGNVLYTLDFHAVWGRFGVRFGKDLPEVQAALYHKDIFVP